MVTKPKTKAVTEEVAEVEESKDVQTELTSEPLQVLQIVDIKHVFRIVSSSGEFSQGEGENIHPANVIEDYLNQTYFSQGYTLYSVEHLKTVLTKGGDPLGEHMLYILVKYAQ